MKICIHGWQIKHIDNVDNYGYRNNTNAIPIAHIKILYKTKKTFVPIVCACKKHCCVLHVNIYLSLLQVLSDVRTAVHWYEHVSAGRCRTNARYYKFHYRIIQTVLPFTKSVENTWKHSYFVTFNIGIVPSFFPLFCKISVKGWVAQLKLKTAKNFENFWALKFQPLEIGS